MCFEPRFQASLFVIIVALAGSEALLPGGNLLSRHIVATRGSCHLVHQTEDLVVGCLIANEAQMATRENLDQMIVLIFRNKLWDIAPNSVDIVIAPIVVALKKVSKDVAKSSLVVAKLIGTVNDACRRGEFRIEQIMNALLYLSERHSM